MFTPPCPREAKEVQHTCDFHVIWEWLSKDGGKLLALVNHSYGLDNSPKISTHQILLWDVNTRDVILAKDLASLKAANKISLSAWYPRGANIAVISEDETISILEEITVTVQPGTLVLYAHTMDSWTYSCPQGTRRARGSKTGHIEVEQLRRPLAWYGVFWLPEFYLTALCAIGLAWSIRRDGRGVGGNASTE